MRILHCLDHYMPAHMAGTEMYAHTLASAQKASGEEVSVLVPHFEHYLPGKYLEHYCYQGLDVYQYMEPTGPSDRAVQRGQRAPAGLPHFVEMVERLRPELIHFHELTRSIGLGVEHLKAAKATGAKVVMTMHISGYTCNTGNLIRGEELCDGVIREFTCSKCCFQTFHKLSAPVAAAAAGAGEIVYKAGLTDKLPAGRAATMLSMPSAIARVKDELVEIARYTDRIVSLTDWYKQILGLNGVPAEKITIIRQALAAKRDGGMTGGREAGEKEGGVAGMGDAADVRLPLRILFMGRIQPEKGLHLLIEAVAKLPPGQVQLDIFGKPEASEYDRLCRMKSEGVAAIRWMGLLEHGKVLERMRQYHFLCLPSAFSEMSPLVIQEAFAAGIPVLVSRVYGNAEQVKEGENGWLFQFNDSGDLLQKLQELIARPAAIGEVRAKLKPVDDFSRVVNDYKNLYNLL